jgi:protein gp37
MLEVTKSKIAWTERVWNPVTGCTKVSPGCKNCYAEAIAHRYWGERKFSDVQCHEDRLDAPLHWRKPSRVFVNSMSDLFHEDVPDEFVADVFRVMAHAQQHTFQVLTKRPRRMRDLLNGGDSPLPNVWLGVSVENEEQALKRIPFLLQTPAAVRWLSVEPMLGPVGFFENPQRESSLDWIVIGGESGRGFRQMEIQWLDNMVMYCVGAGVPVFVKQDSGRFPGKQGRIPDHLWIKEYPEVKL